MKKIVGLLAMLALVFVLAGCPDPVNPPASERGSDPAIGGETFTKPENVVKEFELVKNPYADGGALETQIKIPTGFDKLAVGDKVRLVMKGAVNPALGAMEICLVDTTQAANWWTMLDDNKYEAKDMVNFDIDHTFTVTKAPIGSGSDSMMIVINGKDNDVTKTMYCTEYSVTIVADDDEGGEDVPPAGDEGDDNGEPKETVLLEGLALSWSGTDTIGDNMADIKVGDKVYFTLTATGTQECQFIKKGWAGGLGTDVISIYDAETDAVVTYYAGGENAGDPKDRPAVSLDGTKTFYFIVTDAFMELKDVATVVGTATVVKMWY